MSANERSGWRDQALIEWHRKRDLVCRVAGIQLLMLEFNHGTPVALVEYRRYEDGVPNTEHPVYRALSAHAGDLPFLIAYTHRQSWGFHLAPLNLAARRAINGADLLSEAEYVVWLHSIRADAPILKPKFPRGFGKWRPPHRPDKPAPVPRFLSLDGASWPGEEISRRHREWGDNCPVVDVDYVLVDTNSAKLIGLAEYKHENAAVPAISHPSITAQRHFARGLPFMLVRYTSAGPRRFTVKFIEGAASPREPFAMSEDAYAGFLEWLRQSAMQARAA